MVMHLIDHQAHHEILQQYTQKAPSIDEILTSHKKLHSPETHERIQANSISRRSATNIHALKTAYEDAPTSTHVVQAHGLARVYSGPRNLTREAKMIAEMKIQSQIDNKKNWDAIFSSPQDSIVANTAMAEEQATEAALATDATPFLANDRHYPTSSSERGHL